MAVTNRLGGEEVTHTLVAESRAEAQRWMEAFWQHFYDMSERRRSPPRGTPDPWDPLTHLTPDPWDPQPCDFPSPVGPPPS